ncbi:MAG: multicopper oxidase domain-containing protein [Pseudomonadota bacterium]
MSFLERLFSVLPFRDVLSCAAAYTPWENCIRQRVIACRLIDDHINAAYEEYAWGNTQPLPVEDSAKVTVNFEPWHGRNDITAMPTASYVAFFRGDLRNVTVSVYTPNLRTHLGSFAPPRGMTESIYVTEHHLAVLVADEDDKLVLEVRKFPTFAKVGKLVTGSEVMARVLDLKLGDFSGHIIAYDGQPIDPVTIPASPVALAPAQRMDLAVRVPPEAGHKLELKAQSRDVEIAIAEFRSAGSIRTGKPLISLPDNPLPRTLDLSQPLHTELRMEGGAMGQLQQASLNGKMLSIRQMVRKGKAWAFNGTVGRTDAPLFSVRRGQTVLVNIINDTAWPHAMHFHGHHVRVIERNGETVKNAPWRDTELMHRTERITVAMPADNPGKWMLHCHMLEHQAAGMATWFEVSDA